MNHLVDLLQKTYNEKAEKSKTFPNWVCVVLVSAFVLILLIVIGTTCLKKSVMKRLGKGCGSCGVGVTTTVDLGEVPVQPGGEDDANDAHNVDTSTDEALQGEAGRRTFRHPLFLSQE